jgi:hypothetical protein
MQLDQLMRMYIYAAGSIDAYVYSDIFSTHYQERRAIALAAG